MELKNLKINFLGDSITEGAEISAKDKRFTDLIAKKTGAVCRNYGVGGTDIGIQHYPEGDWRREINFCNRALEMDTDADVVVVFGGTNDFGHGTVVGEMSDRTIETFYGALHILYTELLERFPTAEIFVITPIHRFGEQFVYKNDYNCGAGQLIDYVNAIRQVAEYYGLPVLDMFAQSGLQPALDFIRERYMPDGLHPNDAGHEILAQKIISYIEKL